MDDNMPAPNVANYVCQGDFTLKIMAYRKLTQDEALFVAGQYLQACHRKHFPKSGTVTYFTLIGSDTID